MVGLRGKPQGKPHNLWLVAWGLGVKGREAKRRPIPFWAGCTKKRHPHVQKSMDATFIHVPGLTICVSFLRTKFDIFVRKVGPVSVLEFMLPAYEYHKPTAGALDVKGLGMVPK